MAYKVSLTGPAEADAYAAFERIREVAPHSAARWLTDCGYEDTCRHARPLSCDSRS